ncbi:NmrA-like family protein [Xylariaceae sp. AK1471]|nr:NmrA-like family protein [Xylariaceae sp. AK1471]
MAIIAVAGGHGNVGPHIIDALATRRLHKIIVLSRRPCPEVLPDGVSDHRCVDFADLQCLVAALAGVEVVLSFILPYADQGNVAQKTLIDACIEAGVRRFAPSEWATSSNTNNPFYRMRDDVRRYLDDVNRERLVLEYTCFQPGLFLDYFTYPMQSAKHLKITQHYIDVESRQAILVDGGEQPVTFTLIDDLARVVAEAVEYDGVWPSNGGVAGWQTTPAELVRLGERLRGGTNFTIHAVNQADLEAGILTSPWCPVLEHPSIAEKDLESMSRKINVEALRGIVDGEWAVQDQWNRLLPEFQFADPYKFLADWWGAYEVKVGSTT